MYEGYEKLKPLVEMIGKTKDEIDDINDGKVMVSYREDEGYVVYDTIHGVEFVVGSEERLREKLRDLSKFFNR